MAKRLTTFAVEGAKAGPARREISDGGSGLYLVIQASGARSWAVRYRHAGKSRKLTLDGFPSLAVARRLAAAALEKASQDSVDPAAEKQAAKAATKAAAQSQADLFKNVVAAFLTKYASRNRSAAETERLFRVEVLPQWGERRIQEITKRDVVKLLDGIVDSGRNVTANRVFAAVRKLFNWYLSRQDDAAASPCDRLSLPAQEISRERVLTDDELRWFWKATGSLPYPFGPALRLLAVTAQRREEIAGAPWREFNLGTGEWIIPSARAKNGREQFVPLSPLAVSILESLPRIAGSQYLFTTTGSTPASGYSKAKLAIDAAMLKLAKEEAAERGDDPDAVTLEPWQFHDLRRTAATGFARLGYPQEVSDAVLNHISGKVSGIGAVYNRYRYRAEKTAALNAWADFIGNLADGSKS